MFDPSLNEHQRRVDRLQIAALCGLMLLGTAFIYSARMASEVSTPWRGQSWFRQIVWYVLGTAAAVAVCVVDYSTFFCLASVFFRGSHLPLVSVFVSLLLYISVLECSMALYS